LLLWGRFIAVSTFVWSGSTKQTTDKLFVTILGGHEYNYAFLSWFGKLFGPYLQFSSNFKVKLAKSTRVK